MYCNRENRIEETKGNEKEGKDSEQKEVLVFDLFELRLATTNTTTTTTMTFILFQLRLVPITTTSTTSSWRSVLDDTTTTMTVLDDVSTRKLRCTLAPKLLE